MDDLPALATIHADVRTCTLCPLHETRGCAVPGEGQAEAGVFLVGEAPGRNEDESGRPFCGAAGKNLDLALEAAGLDRERLFVSSIVKCRPPGNRDPTLQEKDACRPFLHAQIRLLRPRVLVALGRHGLSGLLDAPPKRFTSVRGRFCGTFDGIPVWVSLHPAAVIYRQKWREQYLEDWRRFGDWVRSRQPPETFEPADDLVDGPGVAP